MKTLDEYLIANDVPLWAREKVQKALAEWLDQKEA